jgi:membrane protein
VTVTTTLFSLRGVSGIELARRTWAEIRADDVLGRAAQLAYYFFLALFPFLICVIASLSVFGRADRGRALLGELFTRILPATAYQLIDTTFIKIIQSSGPLKMSFGIVASLWSASMGMSAVMDTLNAAYRVKETRSLIKQYAIAIGLTFGLTVLAVAFLLVVVFGDQFAGFLSPGNKIAIAWKILQWPLALAVLLLALAIMYSFAPNLTNRKWYWVTPGSIAGVFLLVAVSTGLRIYVRCSGSYGAVYGSLGAVIVLLVCFYLAGVAILSGGALNGVLENLAAEEEST